MTLERFNERGTIRIHNNIFGNLVSDALRQTEGKAFAASEKGKLLGTMGGRPGDGEIGDNLSIREEEGKLYLECYIITRFGSSIKLVTKKMLDFLENQLRQMFPEHSGRVTIKVVGVKSRHIAERDVEVFREWN